MSLKNLIKHAKKHQQEEHDDDHHHAKHDSHPPHAEGEEGWLVSYADMMTLLCGFFIIMFSMAKMDTPEFEKVKEAVAESMGGQYKSPTEDMKKFVTQLLQEAGIEKETMVKSDAFGVAVIFQSKLFFNTLSSELNPAGRQILDKLTAAVAEREKAESKPYKVVVEGHTDSRPILSGVYPSNWELSGARASRVVRMFLDKGFPAARLTAIGYADTHPEAPPRKANGEWDEDALAKNRRVVVRILEPKVEAIPFPSSEGGFPTGPKTASIAPAAGGQGPGAKAWTSTTNAQTHSGPAPSSGVARGIASLAPVVQTPDPLTLAVTAATKAANNIKPAPIQSPAGVSAAAKALGIPAVAQLVVIPGAGAVTLTPAPAVVAAPAPAAAVQTPAPPAPTEVAKTEQKPRKKRSKKSEAATMEVLAPAPVEAVAPQAAAPAGFDPTKVNLDDGAMSAPVRAPAQAPSTQEALPNNGFPAGFDPTRVILPGDEPTPAQKSAADSKPKEVVAN